ncbi:hypothetical protein KIP88_22810 [Bradyrhizobium sp. SRL28]|uniref:hypothetical protein n=1 Tax=Bradyrhizobium sp. SRL28 TaxID=2836178 RepID=UPI001BDF5507|nr:hypothetical protein [Bradyrhizobium sp. SRL28]MBT1513328.1 hypothetical protein [Bradyrhizobium sp. SRL28]
MFRANRSVEPRRSRPPGQIGNGAARLSCGDMPPGKRCRLGPLDPHSKVMEVSNQLGHFINALKQSLNTTKTTHIPPLTPTIRSSAHCDHMHYETGFSYAGRILFDKRRMQQADDRKTARLTTAEAERHRSAIQRPLHHCSKQQKAPDQQARRKGPKPQGAS